MKERTHSTITVGFEKLAKNVNNKLSYSIEVNGDGSGNVQKSCDGSTKECTIANLLPGRPYGITVKSCIVAAPGVCSIPSNEATIKPLPNGN